MNWQKSRIVPWNQDHMIQKKIVSAKSSSFEQLVCQYQSCSKWSRGLLVMWLLRIIIRLICWILCPRIYQIQITPEDLDLLLVNATTIGEKLTLVKLLIPINFPIQILWYKCLKFDTKILVQKSQPNHSRWWQIKLKALFHKVFIEKYTVFLMSYLVH